jgi:hypothetical protein
MTDPAALDQVHGEKVLISTQVRITPWRWIDANGQLLMAVRRNGRPMEFEKGKAAITVPSREELPRVINTLIKLRNTISLSELLYRWRY